MTDYAGLCIGGPFAGRSVVNRTPVLKVEVKPDLKVMLSASLGKTEQPSIGTVQYNWLHTGGLGLWIVEGLNMNDAIQLLAAAYIEKCSKE